MMKNEEVAAKIDDLKELIEAKLEPLATREDVLKAIDKHSDKCQQKSDWTPKAVQKIVGIGVAAIGGLTGAIYGLIQVIN